jgi:hypothetical protein
LTASPSGDPARAEASATLWSLPSPLDAVGDLRSTAKWTLATAGAVGTVLISGGPLVAVGHVHGTSHALLAGAGLVLAVIGIGLAVWTTSQVLAPRLTTPATLRSRPLKGLRRQLAAEPEQFFGVAATSVEGLLIHQAVAVDLARKLKVVTDAEQRARIQADLERARRNAERAAPYVRQLLPLGHAWAVKKALDRSRWCTLGGGMLVVAGAVLFFIATGNGTP